MTSKGQVTIPAKFRIQYHLLPHSEVEFIASRAGLIIRRKHKENRRGKQLIKHMAGTSTVKMTTDEIMVLTRGNYG